MEFIEVRIQSDVPLSKYSQKSFQMKLDIDYDSKHDPVPCGYLIKILPDSKTLKQLCIT